jgi:acetyltransferase-like isoleucine patch superfamily enzyme
MVIKYLKRFSGDPLYFVNALIALLRGSLYIVYYRVFRRNIKIGFPFKAFSKVAITGPGAVKIGKNCSVYKNVFRGLTIVTYSSNSEVVIGDRCALGGLTIRCSKKVAIGDRVMTASSLIQDSFFVNQDKAMSLYFKELVPEPSEISIGNNVWLTLGSILLGGCNVGNDCVIAAGSWCFDSKINDYSLAIGNPVRKPLPIEKLQRLKGIS